ncbi:uncharacterized protein [Pempheris klunzingeri]|uniref:uncharacterized protein n=1 Tax=Pempheris klunzingeri TaxID=3127111 RepID=UPI00397EECC6
MILQIILFSGILTQSSILATLQCQQRNTSCNDIKTSDGFKFWHESPEGSEIFVYHNKTVIAHAKLGNQTLYPAQVVSMDSHSVTTRHCQDLQVQCIVPNGKFIVKEICVEYKIIEKMKNPVDLPTPWALIIAVSLCVLALIGIIVICFLWINYRSWKRDLITQHGAAPVSQLTFSRYLLTRLRRRSSQPEEIRQGIELQDRTADDLETQHNTASGIRQSQSLSATLPRGSEENINEQDDTLRSVHVDSIDPEADGTTPPSLSLNHNHNEGIQLSKNGDTCAPDGHGASHHRGMNRNMRDDPGGVNDNKGKETVCEMHNGWTRGDCGPEDHENEGQPLLSSQRAAIQGFDMTGEAAALVNKRVFDQDQVSRCSTALDTDVESTPLN